MKSTVIRCEAKYELTKRGCQGGIFSEIEVLGQEKGRYLFVIVISEFLKRYSKAKGTSLFTSAATNQRGFSKGGQKKLRSDFQSTGRGKSIAVISVISVVAYKFKTVETDTKDRQNRAYIVHV